MKETNHNEPERDNFDAMRSRILKARWVVTADLQLETASHFGGQGDSTLDMPILRCARTDRPLLTGTSLGGALRASLLDRLAGYAHSSISSPGVPNWEAIDQLEVAMVFGGSREDREGSQSPLIVFDALGTLPPSVAHTEVRDGVMIETAMGTAADHKKFDFEVLPPGTTFEVRFDMLVPEDADEESMLSLLCASMEGLGNGDIRVGMRRSRGLGELKCANWKARRFELSKEQGWLEWIASDHEHPLRTVTVTSACPTRAVEAARNSKVDAPAAECRERIVIEAEASILGEILIRSPNAHADGPDVMHLSSGGQPVVTGTGLTGTIRAHALRIARLVHRLERSDAEEAWIAPLFGPREERTRNSSFKPRGSRLRVSERKVSDSKARRVTRVAIDRFTQGVVPTALFGEEPQVGGTVKLRFELRSPRKGEAGLLLLALKDLLTGRLPVGGTGSVGRGVLLGRSLTVKGNDISPAIQVDFDASEARRGAVPVSAELNSLVHDFVSGNGDGTNSKGAAS